MGLSSARIHNPSLSSVGLSRARIHDPSLCGVGLSRAMIHDPSLSGMGLSTGLGSMIQASPVWGCPGLETVTRELVV